MKIAFILLIVRNTAIKIISFKLGMLVLIILQKSPYWWFIKMDYLTLIVYKGYYKIIWTKADNLRDFSIF